MEKLLAHVRNWLIRLSVILLGRRNTLRLKQWKITLYDYMRIFACGFFFDLFPDQQTQLQTRKEGRKKDIRQIAYISSCAAIALDQMRLGKKFDRQPIEELASTLESVHPQDYDLLLTIWKVLRSEAAKPELLQKATQVQQIAEKKALALRTAESDWQKTNNLEPLTNLILFCVSLSRKAQTESGIGSRKSM